MKKYLLVLTAIMFFSCTNEQSKDDSNQTEVKAASSSTAKEFIDGYAANKAEYDSKYIDQIITVSGTVANAISVDDGFNIEVAGEDDSQTVSCKFEKDALIKENLPKYGENITISGKCTGYSEEMEMGLKTVYLVQCLINK